MQTLTLINLVPFVKRQSWIGYKQPPPRNKIIPTGSSGCSTFTPYDYCGTPKSQHGASGTLWQIGWTGSLKQCAALSSSFHWNIDLHVVCRCVDNLKRGGITAGDATLRWKNNPQRNNKTAYPVYAINLHQTALTADSFSLQDLHELFQFSTEQWHGQRQCCGPA